jgi:hypothetical protein
MSLDRDEIVTAVTRNFPGFGIDLRAHKKSSHHEKEKQKGRSPNEATRK